jgi:hypothetical protein
MSFTFSSHRPQVLGPVLKQGGLSNSEAQFSSIARSIGTTIVRFREGYIAIDMASENDEFRFLLMGTFFFIFSLSITLPLQVFWSTGLGVGCSQVSAVKAVVDWFPFKAPMGISKRVNVGGSVVLSVSSPYPPIPVVSCDEMEQFGSVGLRCSLLFLSRFPPCPN